MMRQVTITNLNTWLSMCRSEGISLSTLLISVMLSRKYTLEKDLDMEFKIVIVMKPVKNCKIPAGVAFILLLLRFNLVNHLGQAALFSRDNYLVHI